MTGGRPRTAIGTYGAVYVMRNVDRCVAETRVRDLDGRLRKVTVTAGSPSAARALLKERLLIRPGYGSGGVLSLSSPFGDLVALWLADLELRELAEATKESYRDQVRLHVLPAFEHFTLGEITTGRVEWFLKSEAKTSDSRARRSRTMLNLLFRFALRHDAIARNPVEGTSPLRKPKGSPQALTLEQVAAIRVAAAVWRTGPGLPEPKPDGQVRDIVEVLLGTAMRPGEVLALRPCDIEDGPSGMIASVTGTVVHRKGRGAVRQGTAEDRLVGPAHPGAGVRCRRAASAAGHAGGGGAGSDHLRQPHRRSAQSLQRAPHLPRVPRPGRPRRLRGQPAVVPTHGRHGDRAGDGDGCSRDVPRPLLDGRHRGSLHRARPDRRSEAGGVLGTHPAPGGP